LSPDRIAAGALARATYILGTVDPFDWQPHGDPRFMVRSWTGTRPAWSGRDCRIEYVISGGMTSDE
jgi:hypothetical protein